MAAKPESAAFFEERFHGRERARPKDIRLPYERDHARLVHSAAFRRLQGKTQVMGAGEGDFHRTRLTHSIECGQIGTGLLDQLERTDLLKRLPKKWLPTAHLIEAACFAHDIGHPPFGHGGEVALQEEMWSTGGFEGNAHTLRVLTRLEKYSYRGWGINPTRRFILAILKYPVQYSDYPAEKHRHKPPKCYFNEEGDIVEWALSGFHPEDLAQMKQLADGKPKHRTFDCSIMELADDIAYGVHDIEDIVARNLADRDEVRSEFKKAFKTVGGSLAANVGRLDATSICNALFKSSFERKQAISRLVSTFCTAVRVEAHRGFRHPLLRLRATLPPDHLALLRALRQMSFSLVIERAPVRQLERRGQQIVKSLFTALRESPKELVPKSSWRDGQTEASQDRRVCDYLAGMTDSYAEKVYRRLFVPGYGSSSDEL